MKTTVDGDAFEIEPVDVVLVQVVLGLNVDRVSTMSGLPKPNVRYPIVASDEIGAVHCWVASRVLLTLYTVLADVMDEVIVNDNVRRAALATRPHPIGHVVYLTVLDHYIIHVPNENPHTSSAMNLAIADKCVVPFMTFKP